MAGMPRGCSRSIRRHPERIAETRSGGLWLIPACLVIGVPIALSPCRCLLRNRRAGIAPRPARAATDPGGHPSGEGRSRRSTSTASSPAQRRLGQAAGDRLSPQPTGVAATVGDEAAGVAVVGHVSPHAIAVILGDRRRAVASQGASAPDIAIWRTVGPRRRRRSAESSPADQHARYHVA